MKSDKFGTPTAIDNIKFVFKLCGQWPLDISSKPLVVLYNCYSLTIIITFFFLFDITICVYIFFTEDVREATENLYIGLTLIAAFGNLLNFRLFLRKIQNLLRMDEEFQLENDCESELVDRQMTRFNKLVILVYCLSNVTLLFNIIGAVMSTEIRLLYLAWFPFNWKSNSTTYVWALAYQVVGVILVANLNMSVDLLMAYFMHVASIKLDILGGRLQKLGKVNEDGRPNQRKDTKDLVRCILIYQRIWKYTQEVQKCFTYGLFIQITLSGTIICFTAYQLTGTSPQENVGAYTYLLLYLLIVIFQIAIPCYFANEITLKHSSLSGSIFNCGWHFRSVCYGRIVTIFMELVKYEWHISAGNWIILNLDLFVSIMNFAYRLYTVLV